MLTPEQLTDLAIAKSLYLRRVETGMQRAAEAAFAMYLAGLLAGVTKRTRTTDFASLSRGELRQIMVFFRALEGQLRPEFENEIRRIVSSFVGPENELQRALWAWSPGVSIPPVYAGTDEDREKWTRELYGFVTGSGYSLSDYVDNVTASVRVDVSKTLLSADSLNMPTEEMLAALAALESKPSYVAKVGIAIAAAVIGGAALAFDRFAPSERSMWISVVDSHTSERCLGLNRQVFRVGEGPLPPAHPWCRSTRVPFFGKLPEFTLASWLDAQKPADRVAMTASASLTFEKYQERLFDYGSKTGSY